MPKHLATRARRTVQRKIASAGAIALLSGAIFLPVSAAQATPRGLEADSITGCSFEETALTLSPGDTTEISMDWTSASSASTTRSGAVEFTWGGVALAGDGGPLFVAVPNATSGAHLWDFPYQIASAGTVMTFKVKGIPANGSRAKTLCSLTVTYLDERGGIVESVDGSIDDCSFDLASVTLTRKNLNSSLTNEFSLEGTPEDGSLYFYRKLTVNGALAGGVIGELFVGDSSAPFTTSYSLNYEPYLARTVFVEEIYSVAVDDKGDFIPGNVNPLCSFTTTYK
jgi:hypothetical protein